MLAADFGCRDIDSLMQANVHAHTTCTISAKRFLGSVYGEYSGLGQPTDPAGGTKPVGAAAVSSQRTSKIWHQRIQGT